MEVIKDNTVEILNCNYCNSTIKVSFRDILKRGPYYRYWICPLCKVHNKYE